MLDEEMTHRRWLILSAGWLILSLSIGIVLGGIWLRPGTTLFPLDERMAYIASRPIGWTIGWAMWMVAAFAEVAFLYSLARCLQNRSADLALVLGVAGVSVDLLSQVIQVTVIPRLAAQAFEARAAFVALEGVCIVGSMVIGPSLYTIALAAVTAVAPRGARWERAVFWSAVVGGGLMTASGFTTDAFLMGGATVISLGTYSLWAIVTTRSILRRAAPAALSPAEQGSRAA